MKVRMAAPPVNQVSTLEIPSNRFEIFEGGGCGYVRGGTSGAGDTWMVFNAG
jgi:hypothetical protein